ncbi:MAG: 2OG-Fe(II) oxygenase family protein, partial [Woeseiaceae bacterium]
APSAEGRLSRSGSQLMAAIFAIRGLCFNGGMPSTKELRQGDPLAGRLTDALPVIEASSLLDKTPDAERAAALAIRNACLQTGFFYVRNSFQESGADTRLLTQMKHFFELPDNDSRKQAVSGALNENGVGWTPPGGESAYQPGTIAHVESFDFARMSDATNLWPDLDEFRRDVTNYWNVVAAIGSAILERLALAVGLDRTFFVDRCRTEELNTLRLLHYPESNIGGDETNVGISAHTDFECLSLLYQTGPGLELTDVNGNWYDTPATDGGLFVFIDDMLETWTNGLLKATGHRVRHTSERRFSIVMFMAVDDGVTVQPQSEFDGISMPGTYPPVRQRAHIKAEMARARANTGV